MSTRVFISTRHTVSSYARRARLATLDGMTQAITAEAPATQDTHDSQAARVEAEAPEGWRIVWLPRHGVFLAFMHVDMPPGISRPAVYAATADETLAAIHGHQRLSELVREWIQLHEAGPV